MKIYLVSILMAMLAIVGCSTNSPTMTFILPDGFKGLVLISEDKNDGLDLRAKNGEYTIEIPQSGHLVVRNFKPFNRWHKTKAQYKSGGPIVYQISTSTATNLFFGLPSVQDHGIYYFLGTTEAYKAISKVDFHELPLAKQIDLSNLK